MGHVVHFARTGGLVAAVAATASTTTAISRLARRPGRNEARWEIRAPNTATASVPPTWRLQVKISTCGANHLLSWSSVKLSHGTYPHEKLLECG
jgi:hypothetical protein